jgi:hypothetical protein
MPTLLLVRGFGKPKARIREIVVPFRNAMQPSNGDPHTLHLAIHQANSAACGSFDGMIG